jgi:hypothetical protein
MEGGEDWLLCEDEQQGDLEEEEEQILESARTEEPTLDEQEDTLQRLEQELETKARVDPPPLQLQQSDNAPQQDEDEYSNYASSRSALSEAGQGMVADKRELVQEAAYRRHLRKMQTLVDGEDMGERQIDEQRFQRELLAQMRHAERIDERKQLQSYIKDQMQDNRSKVEREKLIKKLPGASSLTMQSPSFHLSADQLTNEERAWTETEKQTKEDLKQSLHYQMNQKASAAKAVKDHDLVEERRFLQHVSSEINNYKQKKMTVDSEKQRELTDAWARDSYMKQLLKMRREQLATKRPNAFETFKQGAGDQSVGYDVRSMTSSRSEA